MRPKLEEVVNASLALARSSNPADELRVIEFNDSVRDVLGGRRLTAADTPEFEAALHTLAPKGRTALYDALLDALNHLQDSSVSRKVIVLVSDGADNASVSTFDRVLARARRSNVTIYAIGIFDDKDPDADDQTLKRLAHETGGERFHPRSQGPLIQACEQIARQIRAGYSIGFVSPDHDGRFHRIRVDVEDPRRLVVRTRPGYFAATASTP
jgi:Ca-activated chloride channel family protein